MTNLPYDEWKPPLVDKRGYPAVGKTRPLADIHYVVYHSAEGWRDAIMPIQNNPNREASWPGTILTDGVLWGHYQVEDICWTSGTMDANTHGLAIEFEGVKGTPITDAQVQTGAKVFAFLQTICPNLGAPVLGQGFREHRSFGGTTCPNDRIRWNDIAAALEVSDMPIIFKNKTTGQHALQGEMGAHGIGSAAHLDALIRGGAKVVEVDDATYKAVPPVPNVRQIVREEIAAAAKKVSG